LGCFDKGWHDVHTDSIDVSGREFANQPSFAAADIQNRMRRTVEYGVDDRLIGDLFATLDAFLAHRGRPWQCVLFP